MENDMVTWMSFNLFCGAWLVAHQGFLLSSSVDV